MKTQTIAAIDIGSNSLKLVIVEAAASDSFTVISQERERVRLGHETLRNRFLSEEALNLSADAIAKFRSIADTRGVDTILAVATASVREAENAVEFVAEIKRRTGVEIEVLSSMEEARLIGVAVAQYFGAEDSSLLNIDIGGGSTELSLMRNNMPEKLFSMKLGAVGLTERFLLNDPPKKKEFKNLRAEIASALDRPAHKIGDAKWKFSTGTSGTIQALGRILNAQMDETPVDLKIDLKKLISLNKKLAKTTVVERSLIPTINERRAEVIVAGGQILEGVMRTLNIETLQTCGYALREGVIIDYLREIEAESLPPVPDVEDLRLRDVFAIGRRYGYEEKHSLQVAFLAERIFDDIAPIFDLKRRWRTYLSAAALLHDVGYHISHESHHKHSLYLIKHSEMTGFSELEKLAIANIARYHRRAMPKEKHTDYMMLNEKDRSVVFRLASILRIAEGLDYGYNNHVENLKVSGANSKKLWLELYGKNTNRTDVEAVVGKKEMFEIAFDCKLETSLGSDERKFEKAGGK